MFHSHMIWQAVSCVAKASFQASSRAVRRFSRAERKVFLRGGYALGSYLCSKENGETLVLQSTSQNASTPVFSLNH